MREASNPGAFADSDLHTCVGGMEDAVAHFRASSPKELNPGF